MKGKSCNRFAQVNVGGEMLDSLLHQRLLSETDNRHVANLIYARYLLAKSALDAKGYRTNSQGEHNMADVLEFFNLQGIRFLITDLKIQYEALRAGLRDANGLKVFNDPLEAMQKADAFNTNNPNLTAYVVRHGTTYQVIALAKSSKSNFVPIEIKNRLEVWDKLKQILALNNFDIDKLRIAFSDIIDISSPGLVSNLYNLVRTNTLFLDVRTIDFLVNAAQTANPNANFITRLKAIYGDNFAEGIYNDIKNFVGTNRLLIDNVLQKGRDAFSTLDINFINSLIGQIDSANQTTYEYQVGLQLNQMQNIDINQIKLTVGRVGSLSKQAANAVVILERRIKKLENKQGTKDEVKRLKEIIESLMQELESKRYYSGLIDYLSEVSNQINDVTTEYNNLANNGTPYENAINKGRVIARFNDVKTIYKSMLEDLSDTKYLLIDESVSLQDILNLEAMSKKILEQMNDVEKAVKAETKECMTAICEHILGTQYNDKYTIAQIVEACSMDTWGTDILYSFGKLSDPICAAVGDITRTLQDKTAALNLKLAVKIRLATLKLYKAGFDSKFMYEDSTHILSEYDWEAYEKAKSKQRKLLEKQLLTDAEIEDEMEIWEQLNTVLKEVDKTTHRSERVPNANYMKQFNPLDALAPALREYYETMMDIKGELGTLLPEVFQKQYFPPQIRRKLMDAITKENVTSIKGLKDLGKAAKDKLQGEFVFKEGADTEFGLSGSYVYAEGDVSGKENRTIPIFYMNKVDKEELLKNFSAAISAMGATAYNYQAMSEIQDIVEYMRDYAHSAEHTALKSNTKKAQNFVEKNTEIISDIKKRAAVPIMLAVLDNLIDKHLYGYHMKGNVTFNKIMSKMIGYTSLKGLATNWLGSAANLLVGELQTWQMALGNTLLRLVSNLNTTPYFNLTDWLYGFAKLWGNIAEMVPYAATLGKVKKFRSPIVDIMERNKSSKDYLCAEYFDLFNENNGTFEHETYRKGIKKILKGTAFILYSAGEYAIRYHALYAMMRHRKLTQKTANGDITMSLRKSMYKSDDKYNPELLFKPNLYDGQTLITDDNGNLTLEGEQYIMKFRKDLRYCCQGMFGAMNDEDKGVIHMNAVGRMGMNFRQWMIGHYSERFRGIHWDYDKKEFVKGYYNSAGSFIRLSLTNDEIETLKESGHHIKFYYELCLNMLKGRTNIARQWAKSTETQKLDLMRLLSGVFTYFALFGASCFIGGGMVHQWLLGDEDEEKKRLKQMSPARKFAYYQCKRMLFEMVASCPIGAVSSYELILKSPFPAIRTFDNALYFITGLDDIDKKLQRGPAQGLNKYWHNVKKYNLPFFRDYERLKNFPDSEVMFGIFDSNDLK